jgi:hypothetical protein
VYVPATYVDVDILMVVGELVNAVPDVYDPIFPLLLDTSVDLYA